MAAVSCKKTYYTITNKNVSLNVGVDPSGDPNNMAVLLDPSSTDDCQKWTIEKHCKDDEDLWSFRNAANDGYLCVDKRDKNKSGLRTSGANKYEWIMQENNDLYKLFHNQQGNAVNLIKEVEDDVVNRLKLLPWNDDDADAFLFDISEVTEDSC